MKGLFEYWLEIEKTKTSQKLAIEALNQACGTKYTESWPSKMAGRHYSLERMPTEVRRYMMNVVIPVLFPNKSKKEYQNLVLALT